VQVRYGWTPTLTSAADAYRSLAIQTRIFLERYTTDQSQVGADGKLRTRANGGIKDWNGRTWYRRDGVAVAATPGTSNHGLGRAVDVAAIGGFTGARYQQFAAVAGPAGWTNTEGRSIGEPWHWVYQGNLDTVANPIGGTGAIPGVPTLPPLTPIEEIDMPLSEADLAAIEQRVFNTLLTNVIRGQELRDRIADAVWDAKITGTPDGGVTVWTDEARAWLRDARLDAGRAADQPAAASPSVDVAALALALKPLLSSGLTEAQVVAAVRTVFADAGHE